MKTVKLKTLLASLTAGFTVMLGGALSAAEVVINTKIEPPRTEPVIYKMEMPRLSEKDVVERCANILERSNFKSVSPEMFKPAADRLAMSGKEIEVSMNKSGTEFFFSNFSALKLSGKTGRLPSDEEAEKLSLAYLNKTGLMPKNEKELKVDRVGGIMQMLSNGEKPEKKASVVYFYRELDGMRVANFGSSITVTLADSELPAGLQYHWREVASRETLDPRSFLKAERIYDLIKEDANRVFAKNAVIVVDKVELVLHDNGGNYIQPAFRYEGLRKADKKEGFEEMPVLGYVPAVEKVYEPITHPAFSEEMNQPTSRSGEAEQGETE